MKEFNIRKFVEEGYLQEVNRQFFHPLGLALMVDIDNEKLKCIIYTDDLEGIIFAEGAIDTTKACRVAKKVLASERIKRFGWVLQPLPGILPNYYNEEDSS